LTQPALKHGVARGGGGARFRHIVFKGSGRRGAVDLAPRPAPVEYVPPPLHPRGPQLTPDEARFVNWLFAQGGLDARAYRPETLRRRLPACLRALRASSVADARLMLQDDPAAIADAVNTMVIGVTGFFRDTSVFDHLSNTVLPALPQRRGRPRVWSAGCSDGEELYSVAMLLAEMGLLPGGGDLLGTDCRPQAVARARAGRYDQRVLRDVPPPWREKYFEGDGGTMARVRPKLRAAVQWRTGDLTRLCEPGAWDLILCRNMTMYLRADVAARVWGALENALRPGGFLVLGKAERPLVARRLGVVAPCIYRRDRTSSS
jgi:chemotaxis methyl-accepting protein methylase